jgi:hypothetical protein
MDCSTYFGPTPDATSCTNTNIGDGVALAGSILAGQYPAYLTPPAGGWPQERDQSLWVVLLLTDGSANAGTDLNNHPLCPASEDYYTWYPFGGHPLCRDNDALTRHCWPTNNADCLDANAALHSTLYQAGTNSYVDQQNYDGDDRARDMFDVVSSNNTLIFTIGMGYEVTSSNPIPVGTDKNGISPSKTLLQYGAYGTHYDLFNPNALKGMAYFGSDPAALTQIFLKIANNLATRINQ